MSRLFFSELSIFCKNKRGCLNKHSIFFISSNNQVAYLNTVSSTSSLGQAITLFSNRQCRFASNISTDKNKSRLQYIKDKLKDEYNHYKNGSLLFILDVKLASRYSIRLLQGKTLTPRERLQLKRTFVDMCRIVPFLALVVIPFAEFALPFIIRFFPGFLPTSFRGHRTQNDTLKQKLFMDLEYRSTMYDEIEKYHFKRTDNISKNFAKLMDEVRAGRKKLSHKNLIRYSKYMTEDDVADVLSSEQLQSLFNVVWDKHLITNPEYVDDMTQYELDIISNSDQNIKEMISSGFDDITRDELIAHCDMRGLSHKGCSNDLLKQKLHRWVDYSLNQKVPVLFLLLTRIVESDDTEYATNVIKTLPKRILDEIEINIAEEEGEKLDHETMREIIEHEEELIKKESEGSETSHPSLPSNGSKV